MTGHLDELMSYEAEMLEIIRAFAVRRAALRRVTSKAQMPAALLALKFEKALTLRALKERRAMKTAARRQARLRMRAFRPEPGG